MQNEDLLLRIRINDPYTILGVCTYFSSRGYDVPNLFFMGKLNASAILKLAKLNKWIDIVPYWKSVHVEAGSDSVEEIEKRDSNLNQIIFYDIDALITYMTENNLF